MYTHTTHQAVVYAAEEHTQQAHSREAHNTLYSHNCTTLFNTHFTEHKHKQEDTHMKLQDYLVAMKEATTLEQLEKLCHDAINDNDINIPAYIQLLNAETLRSRELTPTKP